MKKPGILVVCVVIGGSAAAQVVTDTSLFENGAIAVDTVQLDTMAGITSFTRASQVEYEPMVTEAGRAREERASARASTSTTSTTTSRSTASGSSKTINRTGSGAKLSLDLATDKYGRKHWKRMNKRSTRKAPNSPPGTVPVH